MPATTETTTPRDLSTIAYDILRHWARPYFGAVPYIEALTQCGSLSDRYGPGGERADDLVNRLLSNCGTWRGPDARRIKQELRSMLEAR